MDSLCGGLKMPLFLLEIMVGDWGGVYMHLPGVECFQVHVWWVYLPFELWTGSGLIFSEIASWV